MTPETDKALVAIAPLREFTCGACGGSGDLLIMDEPGPLCLACAARERLLMRGVERADARARAHAEVDAVLDRWRRP